jgi:hypothetical protein
VTAVGAQPNLIKNNILSYARGGIFAVGDPYDVGKNAPFTDQSRPAAHQQPRPFRPRSTGV